MVTILTDGAPDEALSEFLAPIAPEPLLPDVSAPMKLITVMEEMTDWERVAVTVTRLKTEGANARHISAVPSCWLARCTRDQLSPAPRTPLTVTPGRVPSVAINASSSSLAFVVEKVDVAVVADADPRSPNA